MLEIVLALDIGKSRSGIARSDAMGIVIKALKTIPTDMLIEEIESLLQEYGINKIIVGKPINIEQGSQDTAKFIEKTTKDLQLHFPKIQFEFMDERYTSKEAEQLIKSKGVRLSKENKGLIDMYAAAIILEQYFDQQEE